MPITVISALSFWAREKAFEKIFATIGENGSDPVALMIDSLDAEADSQLTFRITRQTATTTSCSTLSVEGNCTSCATLALLRDHLAEENSATELLLVLPVGVSLSTALGLADSENLTVRSATVALDLTTLEDDLWDSRPLTSRGMSPGCEDERTPGEFLTGEISWADTAVISEVPFTHSTAAEYRRAEELLEHIGPHLVMLPAGLNHREEQPEKCGCFDRTEALLRTRSGSLPAAKDRNGENFSTVVVRTSLPIDQEKLGQLLPRMVEGACRVRGTVWLESYPDEKIIIEGIGPAVWLQSQGAAKEQTTAIAITGDDLDSAEIQALLDSCTYEPARAA